MVRKADESESGRTKCKTMLFDGDGGRSVCVRGSRFVGDRRRHDKPSFLLMAKQLSVTRATPQRLSER